MVLPGSLGKRGTPFKTQSSTFLPPKREEDPHWSEGRSTVAKEGTGSRLRETVTRNVRAPFTRSVNEEEPTESTTGQGDGKTQTSPFSGLPSREPLPSAVSLHADEEDRSGREVALTLPVQPRLLPPRPAPFPPGPLRTPRDVGPLTLLVGEDPRLP